jgi:hypothetical protein
MSRRALSAWRLLFRALTLSLFQIALVLVRLDHVALVIENPESRRGVTGCDPCDENVTETSLICSEESREEFKRVCLYILR